MGSGFDNVIVRVLSLPSCVKGVVIPSDDGYYNIYINGNYCVEMQNEILRHELEHVANFDFDNFDDIRIVEERANNY